jgi:uncharacterized protein GlcG (DUF336 family)
MIYESISLDLGNKLVKFACIKAIENEITICVSIFDNHAHLKCFHRMDSTSCGSINISQLKAKTSALLPISSAEIGRRSSQLPGNPYGNMLDILPLPGGLPIFNTESMHIGSIGISGGTPELDVKCANYAVEMIDGLSVSKSNLNGGK